MPVQRYYSSVAVPTTLTGNITSGNTTINVLSPTGFPTSFPFTAAIDYGTATEELVDVTAASLGVWTVIRGVDGTSAQSHSNGAVVRHVSSGRDFADAQTHMAATAAVHGVAGTLVGTSDAQTLANKTLTAPTVNAGALSGTFTGSPTLSGNPTFSGTPSLNNGGALAGTFSGSPTLSGNPVLSGNPSFTGSPTFTGALISTVMETVKVTGDTQARHQVRADGQHLWGSGTAVPDTNLYRGAAGQLKTDSSLSVAPSGTTGTASIVNVTGGSYTGLLADWQLAGASKASIDYQGNLNVANFPSGASSFWAPLWSTSSGLHLPAYGNASLVGMYFKMGRMLVFSVTVTFGSSTTFGSGAGVNDNWIFSMPGGFTAATNFSGNPLPCGFGYASQNAGATVPLQVAVDSTGNNLVLNTAGGRADGTALANFGSIDSLTPFTWANGNALRFSGTVETTV